MLENVSREYASNVCLSSYSAVTRGCCIMITLPRSQACDQSPAHYKLIITQRSAWTSHIQIKIPGSCLVLVWEEALNITLVSNFFRSATVLMSFGSAVMRDDSSRLHVLMKGPHSSHLGHIVIIIISNIIIIIIIMIIIRLPRLPQQ